MIAKENKNKIRQKRHRMIRYTLSGTAERPRLNVYRSINNVYVQFIDDEKGNTIAAASSLDSALKEQLKGKNKKDQALLVGEYAAQKLMASGVREAVFDRGGYLYTGRVKNIADGARKAGLKI
ncbi:MAG: 50S ribosomal protein L18 [Firmicutes bacterium]|nr:50S ribosomal protein L18 [Bacillota bacterium]